MNFVNSTLKILKPAGAGLAGYLAAKALNNIPLGKDANGADKTVGSSPFVSGGLKLAVAVFAPVFLGKKIPFLNEACIGIGMAGVTDIASKLLPEDFAKKIGIAGHLNSGGLHGMLPRRTGNAIAGHSYTRIGCEPSRTETSMHA